MGQRVHHWDLFRLIHASWRHTSWGLRERPTARLSLAIEAILIAIVLTTLTDLRQRRGRLKVVLHNLVLAVGGGTTVGLLHLWRQVTRPHLSIHGVLRWSDRLLIVIGSTKTAISIRMVVASICISNGRHLTRLHHLMLSMKHWQSRLTRLGALVVLLSFLHKAPLVLFGWGSWDLSLFRYESSLELFNLLVIFDNLTFDLGHDVLIGLWDVLLLAIMTSWLTPVEWSARDLGTTLHFGWQIPVFDLLELVLKLLLLDLSNLSAFIVVVNVLLSRIDDRVCVGDSGCL